MHSLALDRTSFSCIVCHLVRNILQVELVGEAAEHVLALDLFDLTQRVLLDEVVDTHKASTNAHQHLITLANLDVDASTTKVIYTFGLAQEQNAHLVLLWVMIERHAE